MKKDSIKYRVANALVHGAGSFTAQECRDNDFYLHYGILQDRGSNITREQVLYLEKNTDDPNQVSRIRRRIQNTLNLYPASPKVKSGRIKNEQKYHDEYSRNPEKYRLEREDITRVFGTGDGRLL